MIRSRRAREKLDGLSVAQQRMNEFNELMNKDKSRIHHFKMPVIKPYESKMLSTDDVAWDRNPCSEVALPGTSHPAIEMKMPKIEDMMRYQIDQHLYLYKMPLQP